MVHAAKQKGPFADVIPFPRKREEPRSIALGVKTGGTLIRFSRDLRERQARIAAEARSRAGAPMNGVAFTPTEGAEDLRTSLAAPIGPAAELRVFIALRLFEQEKKRLGQSRSQSLPAQREFQEQER